MYELDNERREQTAGANAPETVALDTAAVENTAEKAATIETARPVFAADGSAAAAGTTPPTPATGTQGYTGGMGQTPPAAQPSPVAAPTAAPVAPASPVQGAARYGHTQYNTQSGAGYYGAYYNGPYYNAQNTGGGFHSPGTAPGWASSQPSAPAAAPAGATAVKTRKGPGRILAGIALFLVAALAGFGGGYVANLNNQGSSQTVVYRSAEGTTANRTASVENMSVSDVAAAASESVVSITTENIVTNPFMGGQVVSGAGSGVIISADGYIITNNHVVTGADNVIVTLPDGTEIDAEVVGTDPTSDVAVLKVDATNLVPAVLGDSDVIEVGDMCLAIGNPMGTLGGTVTDGIISAKNREITIDDSAMSLLQMSAAVSPGNSGGGLFNANAELIGIVNAKSGGEGTEGLGFAIPINTAIRVAQDLIDLGYVSGRPALGIYVQEVSSAEQALQWGVGALGVYIASFTEDSAAEAAGMEVGDMIVSFNGREISASSDLTMAIQEVEVDDTVEVIVNRGGERITHQVTMRERAAE